MLPGLQPHVYILTSYLHSMAPVSIPMSRVCILVSAVCIPCHLACVPRSLVCSPTWLPSLGTRSPYLRASVTLLLVFLFSLPLTLEPVAPLSPRSSNAHRHLVAARRSAQAPPRPFLTRGLSRTRRVGACASRGPEGVAGKPSA